MDLLCDTQYVGSGAASLIQINSLSNAGDNGDLFFQDNNFGQGQGGYVGTGIFTPGSWHRSPGTITKYVDGIKQHDWRTDSVDGRRALREFAILFADGDADECRRMWVNSVQVRQGKLSDVELGMLGGPWAAGIPIVIVAEPEETDVRIQITRDGANLNLSWPGVIGFALESTPHLTTPNWHPVNGVTGNSAVISGTSAGNRFFRLRK